MQGEGTRACVRFRMPNGDTHELEPGDIIGRLWTSALYLDNPRVSEAHAMISLRDQTLKLLALRGRFAVGNVITSEVILQPGLAVQIVHDLTLLVEAVQLPCEVLAIEGDGLPRHFLSGVSSLRIQPRPELLSGDIKDADACIWGSGIGWSLRIGPTASPRHLLAGDTFIVQGRTFQAVAVTLESAGKNATQMKGSLQSPLHIAARYDVAHIYSENIGTIAINGISARIISELVAFGRPVDWEVLANEIWPDACEKDQLRSKFDVSLARLRKRLREARIRPDLVRANGTGQFELFLHERDRVNDQT